MCVSKYLCFFIGQRQCRGSYNLPAPDSPSRISTEVKAAAEYQVYLSGEGHPFPTWGTPRESLRLRFWSCPQMSRLLEVKDVNSQDFCPENVEV